MATTLPINFPVPSETSIASYDYTDIASGTGIVLYYLAIAEDDTGTHPILTNEALASFGTSTRGLQTSVGTEVNFDSLTFNIQRVVRGVGYLSFDRENTTNNFSADYDIRVYMVSPAGVETEISTLVEYKTTALREHELIIINFTETIIPKGYKIRLSVHAVLSAGTEYIGTDPAGRDAANITSVNGQSTISKFYVPFRIDL